MAPALSCININQQHKAVIKKLVVHYAVSERSCTIEREKAFPSTDGTLDGGSTGLINSGLCVHPGAVLEIRANRRTNCRKTHRDFVWLTVSVYAQRSKAGNTSNVLWATLPLLD